MKYAYHFIIIILMNGQGLQAMQNNNTPVDSSHSKEITDITDLFSLLENEMNNMHIDDDTDSNIATTNKRPATPVDSVSDVNSNNVMNNTTPPAISNVHSNHSLASCYKVKKRNLFKNTNKRFKKSTSDDDMSDDDDAVSDDQQ